MGTPPSLLPLLLWFSFVTLFRRRLKRSSSRLLFAHYSVVVEDSGEDGILSLSLTHYPRSVFNLFCATAASEQRGKMLRERE